MKIAVRYYSRSGNTKKVAEAIAAELGVEAKDVSEPLGEGVDNLFLGSALYAGGVDESIKKFIEENSASIGIIYNFGTAASPANTYKKVKKIADGIGVKIAEEEFHCKGKFLFLHGKHPNESDLKNAREFARGVLKKINHEE